MKIPYKTWLKATDIAADYANAGEAFITAGRPKTGQVHDDFVKALEHYEQIIDSILFANWTVEQREEWEKIFKEN